MTDELSDEYVEAVLTVSASDRLDNVVQWLLSHGLRAVRIQVGLLAQGTREAFEAAIGVNLDGAHLPLSLPVPADLSDAVTSIVIPAPRRYHGSISLSSSR